MASNSEIHASGYINCFQNKSEYHGTLNHKFMNDSFATQLLLCLYQLENPKRIK